MNEFCRFGAKMFFGGGVLCTSILTLLTPLAARTSYKLLIALRVLEGFGEVSSSVNYNMICCLYLSSYC